MGELMIVRHVPRSYPRPATYRVLVTARSFVENGTGDWTTSGRIKTGPRVRGVRGEADNSPFQTEYRRRLWSYLYHADKLYVPTKAMLTFRYR